MINAKQFKIHVIIPTLQGMAVAFAGAASPAAANLLLGTCFHESLGGTYLVQAGGGPARGLYQMEPATELDIWKNYLRLQKQLRLDYMLNMVGHRLEEKRPLLLLDLEYQTAMARLKYYRHNFTWPENPKDVEALGQIWKRVYNTRHGAGTVDQFVNDFPMEALEWH